METERAIRDQFVKNNFSNLEDLKPDISREYCKLKISSNTITSFSRSRCKKSGDHAHDFLSLYI